jgi:hypothetical protein
MANVEAGPQGRQPVHRRRRRARLQVSPSSSRATTSATSRSTRSASAPPPTPATTRPADRLRDARQGHEGPADLRRHPGDQRHPQASARRATARPASSSGSTACCTASSTPSCKRPLPRAAKLTHKARVKDIFDKGKNALVMQEITSATTRTATSSCKQRAVDASCAAPAAGAATAARARDINVPPERAPDKVIEEQVPVHQALLYRLSGDWNPLHADPDFAKAFGFDKPILHGLCSFGYAGRHVVAGFAPDGNPDFMKSIKRAVRQDRAARRHAGDRDVEGERSEASSSRLQGEGAERGRHLERGGRVVEGDARSRSPRRRRARRRGGRGWAASAMPISADIFNAMNVFVKANADVAEKVKTVFQFKLSRPRQRLDDRRSARRPARVTARRQHRAAVHARAERRRLHGDGHRPGRPDEAVLDGQAEDLGRRDGVAEARLPQEDHAGPGDGRDEEARGRRWRGGGEAAAAGGAPAADMVPTTWDVFIAIIATSSSPHARAGREDRRELPVQGDQARLGVAAST